MDSLLIAAVVAECNARLAGTVIKKIFQPGADELTVRLWNGRSEQSLYLLVRSQQARFHLTGQTFPNPFTPPRFCQLLRARLRRLVRVEQVAGDRLVLFHFTGAEGVACRLLLDLRPRPNLVLLDREDVIVDLLRRGDPGERPGDRYRWFDSVRRRTPATSPPLIPPGRMAGESFRRWLAAEIAPLSKLAAADLTTSVDHGEPPQEVLARYLHDLEAGRWQPRLLSVDGSEELAVLPLYRLEHSVLAENRSVSSLLDERAPEQTEGGVKAELSRIVTRGLKRLRKRLARIESDYAGLDDADSLQHTGTLLLSNLHRARRGMPALEVEDYLADPSARISIPLDPRLSPQQNAEQLFKKARKRRRGEEHFVRRLEETAHEIDWLEAMQLAIDETDEPVGLDDLKKQLAAAGYLKLREEPPRRQGRVVASQQLEAVSPAGYQLVWGRNPRENDRISREVAAPDDLWFHAHNLPGCHLVLRRAGRAGEIPEQDVLFAASLAAGYSRAKDDSRVEVIVALAKDVRKPKGAKPGLVTVAVFRTVAVAPRRL